MSEDIEDYLVEPTQEQIEEVNELIYISGEPERKRRKAKYDGIYGILPGWLPTNYKNDFIRIRARLLDIRGYTHDDLTVWLNWYKDHAIILDTEPESDFTPLPRKYPNGDPVDSYCFIDEIGLLAWLRWCVFDIDRESAEGELDIGHSISNETLKGLDSGGRKKGVEANQERSQKYKNAWRRIAIDLFHRHPNYSYERVARYILEETSYCFVNKKAGKKYSQRTIKDAISGTKKEALQG